MIRTSLCLALTLFAIGCQGRPSGVQQAMEQANQELLAQEQAWKQDRQAAIKQVVAVRCRSEASDWFDLPADSVNTIFNEIARRERWPGGHFPTVRVYHFEIEVKDGTTLQFALGFGGQILWAGGGLFVIPQDDYASLRALAENRVGEAISNDEVGTPVQFPVADE